MRSQIIKMILIAVIAFVCAEEAVKVDFAVEAAPKCNNVFRCSPSNVKFEKDVCVVLQLNSTSLITDHNINTDQCTGGSVCVNSMIKDSMCVNKTVTGPYLDQHECSKPADCFSNKCENKKCEGIALNQVCTKTQDCKIGLYCDVKTSKKCLAQVEIGKACVSTYDCVNNAGCMDSKCVEFYSVADEQKSSSSVYCASGEVIAGTCVTTSLTDKDECTTNTVCNYNYTLDKVSKKISKPCVCSLNYSDKQFCPMAADNSAWKDVITKVKSFNKETTKYHSNDRYNHVTKEIKDASANSFQYPKYKDIDTCTYKLMLSSNKLSASLAGLAILIVSLLI